MEFIHSPGHYFTNVLVRAYGDSLEIKFHLSLLSVHMWLYVPAHYVSRGYSPCLLRYPLSAPT